MITAAVIFDCDPGWDDAIALAVALAEPALDIVAVTTVFGNASIAETTRNASRVLGLCGRTDLRVYPGAGSPLSGSGHAPATPTRIPPSLALATLAESPTVQTGGAVTVLCEAALRYGDRLTIVATGPLTNIAQAMTADAGAMARVGRLIAMGGALSGGNVAGDPEFNFLSDPLAADAVLAFPVGTTLIPLETCSQLPITPAFVDTLRETGTPLSRFAAEVLNERMSASAGIAVPLYDVVAALFLLDPSMFAIAHGPAAVELPPSLRAGVLRFEAGRADTVETRTTTSVATAIAAAAGYSRLLAALGRR